LKRKGIFAKIGARARFFFRKVDFLLFKEDFGEFWRKKY